MKIRFNEIALREMHRAASRYEREHSGLGDRFLVGRVLSSLRREPRIAHIVMEFPIERGLRRISLGRFPFSLYIDISDPRTIVIQAVAHDSRRPLYWRTRLHRRRRRQ